MTGIEIWKARLKAEISRSKFAPRTPAKPREHRPFEWQATVNTAIKVTRERALKLASIGESVSPNPRCNWKKWGMKDPTIKEQSDERAQP